LHDGARSNQSKRFLRLSLGFWSGRTRARAWLLTAAVLIFLFANLGAALAVNLWHKFFFDALEQKDGSSVLVGIGVVLALAVGSAASSVGLLHARMRLQVRWRQWFARTLINRWLADRNFYQLTVLPAEADNPEARIAEDGRLAIELLVDFSLGLLNAVLAAASFIGILWVVGGSITLAGYSVPGYFVFACVAYSAITSASMLWLGRPLVKRVEEKAAGEAQLRYELTRVKDNAEIIALTGGDDEERKYLDASLSDLVQRWLAVIVSQGRMMWLNGANLVLAPVVPLLLGTPKYLSGEMSLGTLMQAAAAFLQVQVALNWLADNAMRLADWFASSHRVTQLTDAIDRLEASLGPIGRTETITLGVSPDNRVHLRHLSIKLHDARLMIDGAETIISAGEKVLVKGVAGSGKSTLIHAMAGLWPWGSGEILLPDGASIAFMPQRPYFPIGTLRTALHYSHTTDDIPEDKIKDTFIRCGLEHLIPRLDETDRWSSLLSGSEQQRFAFARVLIRPPDILIMDEATSSLDELSQFRMMEYMRDLLPDTMVIHAGHRAGLEPFHSRQIDLVRQEIDRPSARPEHSRQSKELVARALQRMKLGSAGTKMTKHRGQ
jgi:vitamin B12/bleomycin/antimicrobial peptide transport system ATP-binding/permease protein